MKAIYSIFLHLKKTFYSIMLLAADKPTVLDRIQYILKLIAGFAPVAAFLDFFGVWFTDNQEFFTGMILAFLANMGFGAWYHKKLRTFKWSEFFMKNIKMWCIVLLIYPLLEVIGRVAGDNLVGEMFKVTIQIATLLYPISKAVKNGYILSNKKYPPAFIMERIYQFEKHGNVRDLLGDASDTNQEL